MTIFDKIKQNIGEQALKERNSNPVAKNGKKVTPKATKQKPKK